MSNNESDLYKKSQRMLIASLIYNGSDATRVFELITPEDFQEPSFQLIADAIVELIRTDIKITAISIATELENRGQLAAVGGTSELYVLNNEGRKYLRENSITLYASVVKETSAKAKILNEIKESAKSLKPDSGISAAETLASLQSNLNEQLYRLSDDSTVTQIAEIIPEYFDLLEKRKITAEENAKNGGGLQGIPSLIPTINKITTGWLPAQLITIGARTGIGKSVFAVNSAVAAAEANKSVLFFSLEMKNEEIHDRILSSMSGVELSKIKEGDISAEDKKKLEEASERASKMKIMIETEPELTAEGIRAKALRRAQSPEGLDIIILDYLQLLKVSKKSNNRQEEVANFSRTMKLLAKSLDVPIMVLVQLQREKDDEENSLPQIHQIRESGAIAMDSDIVILIHRDKTIDGEIPDTLLIVAKHRNGRQGDIIRCSSNLEYSLFREIKRAKDAETITDDDLESLMDDDLEIDESDLNDLDLDDELDFGD